METISPRGDLTRAESAKPKNEAIRKLSKGKIIQDPTSLLLVKVLLRSVAPSKMDFEAFNAWTLSVVLTSLCFSGSFTSSNEAFLSDSLLSTSTVPLDRIFLVVLVVVVTRDFFV